MDADLCELRTKNNIADPDPSGINSQWSTAGGNPMHEKRLFQIELVVLIGLLERRTKV
jgi:hypothetical protein